MKRLFAALGIAVGFGSVPTSAARLAAQGPDTTNTIDRIVAVVGNKPIMASQLSERFYLELGGRKPPTDPKIQKQMYNGVLNSLIDEELVIQEAQRDTAIKVTDEEVTQSVDEIYKNVRGRYATEAQFRAQLDSTGFQTIEEWRSYTTEQQRRKFLYDRFWQRLAQEKKTKDVPPTDAEVREYFDQNKGSFRPRSEGVSFKQIVVAPHPSAEAKKVALALADSILTELRKGADFATTAKRFSMDPGTKDQGGSLNWIRRGQGYDPAFEAAAFSLKPGQISDPVESSFGYHLIQVERTQPAEVQVRHILIMPVIDSVNADSAKKTAEMIFLAVKKGASFDSLQRIYHDKLEEREVEQIPLDRLVQQAPAYGDALRDVKDGELAPLFKLDAPDPNRSKWAVLLLTKRIPAGDIRFEDVQDQIRNQLRTVLGRQKYIAKLRQSNFVEIRGV